MSGAPAVVIEGASGPARRTLRIETGRMARFLGLMRDRLALLGDGEIDAVERFCDAAGLVRLVQAPPEGGALVLLAVPSLRMLHFLDRIGCAPWAALAVAFAGVEVPPEAGEVDDLLARAF